MIYIYVQLTLGKTSESATYNPFIETQEIYTQKKVLLNQSVDYIHNEYPIFFPG